MSINIPNTFNAYGSVVGATGVRASGAGFSVAGGTGGGTPGIYAITLEDPVDSAQCAIVVTRRGAAAAADGTFGVAHTSDSVKTVTYTQAGVAADTDFDFAVLNCPAGV